jgi:L-2-hydroxyglutarate oxidase LhgO
VQVENVLIIGGGIYGCFVAEYTVKLGCNTTLIEKESDLIQRASHTNQARVHKGYHYPRSIVTAGSSTRNYSYFVDQFNDAINKNDRSYYAIAKSNSKITASHFEAPQQYL